MVLKGSQAINGENKLQAIVSGATSLLNSNKVTGIAKVTECIHPEVIGISSHFSSYAKGKPMAKGVNFNKLVPYDRDPVSTGANDCVKGQGL